MVEKKEFVILFIKKKLDEARTEFIPYKVVEGTFDAENNWFNDTEDGLTYIHIENTPSTTIGYGCRTTIELKKDSISQISINKLKEEILEYAKKYQYLRDISKGEFIIATDPITGYETLFEDIDNTPTFKNNNGLLNTGFDCILDITPIELEEKIKTTIKGQDAAVRKIVTALWTTLNFRELKKKNMLIIGPTGVGKTAIFEKIKDILNIPLVIFPVPGLSQAGYVGRSVDEILKQVYYEANGNIDEAERSIVILDEIDKIASTGSINGEVSTTAVQNELLKIIEGCDRFVETNNPHEPSFTINTSDMIFIGTGAFQELFEKTKPKIGYNQKEEQTKKTLINSDKLINYGLKRELVGRLPIVVELNNLGKEELKDIILNSDQSELNATINALMQLDIEIENIDEVIDIIVEDALNKKIGARGLIFTLNNIFQEIFYEVGNNQGKYKSVVIGPNIIENNRDFVLKKTKAKQKKRSK